MGMSRTSWAFSMIMALSARAFSMQGFSYPYPDGAMNIATGEFLEGGFDEMIVIDTDIKFERRDLDNLLSHDVPLVFGLYPKKQPGLTYPVQTLEGEENPFTDDGRGDLREVARCARGFMRVKREVFDQLKPIVPTYIDAMTGKTESAYWRPLPGGHSEDFQFCDDYRSIGGRVLVDRRICTQHEGSATYPIPGTF